MWAVNAVKLNASQLPYDVGIVLGGNTISFDSYLDRKIYQSNIDRLLQAIELYEQGKIKKILVTGAASNLLYRGHKEGNMMAWFLRSIGIPDSVVIVDTLAENTHQNAVYSQRILTRHPNLKKVLLITSSMHMKRALACFYHEGIEAIPYATNILQPATVWNFEFFFVPAASNILIWNGLIHEMLGYLIYWIMGYV